MDNLNLHAANLDLSVLDKLTPAQKELALAILQEYSESGKSERYENLVLEDYAEPPVDILTFVDDYNYLGNAWHDAEGNSKLYPYWREELKKIFPDNLTTTVNNGIFSGSRGRGKMNPVSTPVLTSTGFRPMGTIKTGDKVYGEDGNLHDVIGVFPQGKLDVYEVKFSDGTSSKCGLEHLWEICDHPRIREHKAVPTETKIVDTKYLLEHVKTGRKRYSIPMCQPINFPKSSLPLDPYLLGCLIGGGHLSAKNYVSITATEDKILEAFSTDARARGYHLHPVSKKALSFRLMSDKRLQHRSDNEYTKIISDLGLLDTLSSNKFIPKRYLYSSVQDRVALLQGFMDTKGEASKSYRKDQNHLSYNLVCSTISTSLRDDVCWLVQSLGGTAHYSSRTSRYKSGQGQTIIVQDHYRIYIKLPPSITPFRLSRKALKYTSTERVNPSRYIVAVTKLPEPEECQCIYVNSERHLYLVNDFIVTHNTEVATLIAAYLLHRILCLKDPIAYYHLKPTEKIVFAFMNIKLALAEEIGIAKFQNTLQSSPWFMAHGELEGRTRKIWVPKKFNNQVAVDIKIGSQADDLIGLPIFFAFFDEVSFQRNQDIEKQKQKANDMIDTAIGGMKTRFVHKGKNPTFLALASSKRSDKSFLEEHMKKKLKSEKDNVYISDGSVWEVKPKGTYSSETFRVGVGNKFLQSLVIPDEDDINIYKQKGYTIIEPPIDFRADFIDDIDRALCDFAGISSSSISKYINAAAVQQLVTKSTPNPFVKEILEIGDGQDDEAQYYNFFDLSKIDPALKSRPLFIHLDMSYTGDKTGIAGVWIKGKKTSTDALNQSGDLFFSIAFSVSIKAPKGRHISFDKNRNFIYWLKDNGFNIKGITSDTFQSYDTGETLRAKGYPYSVLSVDRVDAQSRLCKPYQYFKSTIYEKRLELYDHKLLFQEITELERNIETGKVDHPDGGSKDVCDALCGAIFNASSHAEEFAYDYGESSERLLRLNSDQQYDDTAQLSTGLEEELKKMGQERLGLGVPPLISNIAPGPSDYIDIIIL